MSEERCKFVCVAAAILAAIIVGYYGGLAIGLGEPLSVIAAAVVGAALWWKLPDWFCPSSKEKTGADTQSTGASAVAKAPETAAASGGVHWSSAVKHDSGETSDARGQTEIKPTAELAEEATLRDGVGSWKYGEDTAPSKAGSKVAAAAGVKPPTLSAPRDGGADDLKLIKGVGPKMETMLNDMGFYHLDQMAAWSTDHVAWVDANLEGFNGRVSRNDWVGQAAALASGGETEFSKQADKGDAD